MSSSRESEAERLAKIFDEHTREILKMFPYKGTDPRFASSDTTAADKLKVGLYRQFREKLHLPQEKNAEKELARAREFDGDLPPSNPWSSDIPPITQEAREVAEREVQKTEFLVERMKARAYAFTTNASTALGLKPNGPHLSKDDFKKKCKVKSVDAP